MLKFIFGSIAAGWLILGIGVTALNALDDKTSEAPDTVFEYVVDSSLPCRPNFRKLSGQIPPGYDEAELLRSLQKTETNDRANDDYIVGYTVFGASNSRSVAIAFDPKEKDNLFVDLDRNGRFAISEKLVKQDSDKFWRVKLASEYLALEGKYEHVECEVLCKLSANRNYFLMATDGCFKGQVLSNDQKIGVLRTDFNSNGRWSDSEDRFLLDVNNDCRFNAITERFSFSPVCKIDGRTFGIAADDRGFEFSLAAYVGSGTLQPSLNLADQTAEVFKLTATLVSKAGVHAHLQNESDSVSVPVGSYRVAELFVAVKTDERVLTMRFATLPGMSCDRVEVMADQTIEFDPLGALKLSGSDSTADDNGRLNIVINPMVSTTTGCYLVDSRVGDRSREFNHAQSESFYLNKMIGSHKSGFL